LIEKKYIFVPFLPESDRQDEKIKNEKEMTVSEAELQSSLRLPKGD